MKVYHKKFQNVSTQNCEIDAKIEAFATAVDKLTKDMDALNDWASEATKRTLRPLGELDNLASRFDETIKLARQIHRIQGRVDYLSVFAHEASGSIGYESCRLDKRLNAFVEMFGFQLPEDVVESPTVPF